jgi:hypothetical protein
MTWYVIFVGDSGSAQSRPAHTREAAMEIALRLREEGRSVRRMIGPDREVIALCECAMDLGGCREPGSPGS